MRGSVPSFGGGNPFTPRAVKPKFAIASARITEILKVEFRCEISWMAANATLRWAREIMHDAPLYRAHSRQTNAVHIDVARKSRPVPVDVMLVVWGKHALV